jgi:hypothetical protein
MFWGYYLNIVLRDIQGFISIDMLMKGDCE